MAAHEPGVGHCHVCRIYTQNCRRTYACTDFVTETAHTLHDFVMQGCQEVTSSSAGFEVYHVARSSAHFTATAAMIFMMFVSL